MGGTPNQTYKKFTRRFFYATIIVSIIYLYLYIKTPSNMTTSQPMLPPLTGIHSYTIPTPDSQPTSIAVGSDRVWFTENQTNKIGALFANGRFQEYMVPTANAQPAGITLDEKGVPWFTECAGNRIGFVNPATATITEFAVPTPHACPSGITAASDGTIWFVETDGNKIGEVNDQGQFREFTLPSRDSEPGSIVVDHTGNIWFTEFNKVGELNQLGVIREYPVGNPRTLLTDIMQGTDASIWFLDSGANAIGMLSGQGRITKYTIPTANSLSRTFVFDAKNNIWFTENDIIGVLTSTGEIKEYKPNPSGALLAIGFGLGGKIWFANLWANTINYFTPQSEGFS